MNAATSSSRRPPVSAARRARHLGLLGVAIAGALGAGSLSAAAAAPTAPRPSTAAAPATDTEGPSTPTATATAERAILDGWEAAAGPHGELPRIRIRAAAPTAPGAPTAPAAVPAAVPVAPAIAAPTTAVVPPLPPDAVARIVVSSIGMDLPVYRGGQHMIDGGVATLFDDGEGGWLPPVAPGSAGTLWIAGHHTTHGAPFLLVDQIAVGTQVLVFDGDGRAHDYRIVNREIVGTAVDPSVVYGTDGTARRLILQTSMGGSHRLLLTGALVA